MQERKAIYYGQVKLIPGIICDGYVLYDGTTVMSLRGTAKLLSMYHKPLQNMATKGIPKTLKPFWDKGLNMATKNVIVLANNSHFKGRNVEVFDSATIESLIRAYTFAFVNDKLRDSQKHIGKRCAMLSASLVRTALEVAIKQACGLSPNIQQTVQQNYVELIKQFGFTCSIDNEIATKKDITKFLGIPESTLNSFLRKRDNDIQPIKLDRATIASGSKAARMNGYHLEDVSKIALGMDSVIGIELKKKAFGYGTIIKPDTKGEIEWQQVLEKVFKGFGFHHNYTIGKYRVDYFVEDLMLILECNGYDNHVNYEPLEEAKREKALTRNYTMVRFHHKISLETLFNGILQAKLGKVIRLYNIDQLYSETGVLNLEA